MPFVDDIGKACAIRMRLVGGVGDWLMVQSYRNPDKNIVCHKRNVYDNFMIAYKVAKRHARRRKGFAASVANRYVSTCSNGDITTLTLSCCRECLEMEKRSAIHALNG